jgi:hypothetical protein
MPENIDAQISALQEQKRTLAIEQAARKVERDRLLAMTPKEYAEVCKARILAFRKAHPLKPDTRLGKAVR